MSPSSFPVPCKSQDHENRNHKTLTEVSRQVYPNSMRRSIRLPRCLSIVQQERLLSISSLQYIEVSFANLLRE